MNAFTAFSTLLYASLVVIVILETLVEFGFGTIAGFFPQMQMGQTVKASIIQVVAVMVGLGGAFLYRFDILYLFGTFSQIPIEATPYGMAITGIAIGKGSNYVHQIIGKFFPAKT